LQAFDTIAMVDWSGGADRGPAPKKDAIWIAVWRNSELSSTYMRNRAVAESALQTLIEAERSRGHRLLIGFDFPFGYPTGFAQALTGRPDPLAVWTWLAEHVTDGQRFQLAGAINQILPGEGPFWGNGLRADIASLSRTKVACDPFPVFRQVEAATKGTFSCWQLSGAGCVGSQVLTGLPVLSRLSTRFAPDVSVWPFEAPEKAVVFAEVFFSVIADDIRAATKPGSIRDDVQVRTLARAVAGVQALGRLAELFPGLPDIAREEGWILGSGQSDLLRAGLDHMPSA
jgi:molybdopterin molybdotransferase